MKNYELFIEHLLKKRLAQADIQPILLVDKELHLEKVQEIWNSSTESQISSKARQKMIIMLKRDLTD